MKGRKQKQRKDGICSKELSSVTMDALAAKPLNLNGKRKVQRPSPKGTRDNRVNRSTAQMYGVGETPLNGKGMTLTGNAEG